jgi:hypothetical protein
MNLLQRLTTMKKPEMQAQSEQTAAANPTKETGGGKPPVRPHTDDPLVTKLIDIVHEVIESREGLKQQVEERERALVGQEDQIRELQYDKGFLEKKLETALPREGSGAGDEDAVRSAARRLQRPAAAAGEQDSRAAGAACRA